MKVYIYYLKLPDNLYDIYDKIMVDCYSIVKSSILLLPKIYNNETSTWIYQYAYTSNKNLANDWESIHDMSMFTKITKKLTRKQYEEFVMENPKGVIVKYIYTGPEIETNDKYIICARHEEYEINETFQLHVNEELLDVCQQPYSAFDTKFIKALDILGYTYYHTLFLGYEDDLDYMFNNMSYGCSREGYVKGKGLDYSTNILGLYVKLYKLLLRKDD